MDIGFKIISYPGALGQPGEIVVKVRTEGPQQRATLNFITVAGARIELVPTSEAADTWRIGVGPGPELVLPGASGRWLSGPPVLFAEFHLLLDAWPTRGGPAQRAPMSLSVEREGRRLRPVDLETGAPWPGDEVAVHGELLDLYLRP